jgi:CBS-domain-containing membrane protein
MNARDVMSKPVVSVHPETPTREIARLLLDKGISAVPVVDNDGAAIGIVSESDLIRPEQAAREAWRQSNSAVTACNAGRRLLKPLMRDLYLCCEPENSPAK